MESLGEQFRQGVQEFQQGQFYECHDTLEALWIEAQEPNKTFLQGVLQISVACYHLSNQNWKGAVILLGEGIRRLSSYRPEYAGLDVEYLIHTSADLLDYLHAIGPECFSEPLHPIQSFVTESSAIPIPVARPWTGNIIS
jgi:uncharacterized protein